MITLLKVVCDKIVKDHSCDIIQSEVTLRYEGEMDDGQITYRLLDHIDTIVEDLNDGPLIVEYNGDKSIDTNMLITLAGVPGIAMSGNEVNYFQGVTKGFLKRKEVGTLKILSVEVQDQQFQDTTSESQLNGSGRSLQESATIEIQTKVAGKYRPPAPGLNFDELVEDSINAEDGGFKEELKSGGGFGEAEGFTSYFENVREVYAKPISLVPTKAPTVKVQPPPTKGGISSAVSIAIVIGAALLTFSIVFGAFVLRKRRRDKQRFDKSIFDEDEEEDPLFFDSFENKKKKNAAIIPFARTKGKPSNKSIVTSRTEAVTEDSRNDLMRMDSRRLSISEYESNRHMSSRFANESIRNGPMVRKDRLTKNPSRYGYGDPDYEGDYGNPERNLGNYESQRSRNSMEYDLDEIIRRKEEAMCPPTYAQQSSRRFPDELEERIQKKYDAEENVRYSRREMNNEYQQQYMSSRGGERPDWDTPDYSVGGTEDWDLRQQQQQEQQYQYDQQQYQHEQQQQQHGQPPPPPQQQQQHGQSPPPPPPPQQQHNQEYEQQFHQQRQEYEQDPSQLQLVRRNDQQGHSIDETAHNRFQRRPSEDGQGISIASASTSSTLSSNFTRLKQQMARLQLQH